MSIVWSNPEPDTSRDGQTHPARTLVSALLGLPSQTQIAQELKITTYPSRLDLGHCTTDSDPAQVCRGACHCNL